MSQNKELSLAEQLAIAKAENEKLRQAVAEANKPRKLTLRVSQAGAVSVYGLGKFPVTLYREQMVKLMDAKEEILGFIEANASGLKTKADKVIAQANA
jgi:hypothetical protein